MTSQLAAPPLSRSGASTHSREEDEFTEQHEENPLDVAPASASRHSIPRRPIPLTSQRHDPLELDADEPPPPYQELDDAAPENGLHIAPVEYSVDNGPQLSVRPELEYMEVAARSSNGTSSQAPELNPVQPQGSPAFNEPSLVPMPLEIRPAASSGSTQPTAEGQTRQPSTFSSAKAREAGFDLESPISIGRTTSSSSLPSVTISTEPLTFTREAGKVTAYLIPFPKPRLRGIKPEDIPDRFLIFTPPVAPLSKPAPGEKESHWHKSQRQWQEDVRKATMNKASAATWKGMKARTTSLIHKGVNMTRSTNVEFLDRVSGGAITSSTEDAEAVQQTQITDAELSSEPSSLQSPASETPPSPHMNRTSTTTTTTSSTYDKGKSKCKHANSKPPPLSDISLLYPPSLPLTPDQIRTEFVDTLLRTRDKSRKDAVVASTLLPLAAALDASLIVTLGGLTQISGAWAYTSTRGAMASRRISKGLARGEEYALEKAEHPEDEEDVEVETHGCTCGHHEETFGPMTTTVKHAKTKHQKKKGIALHMQQSTQLEVLRRYLDLACLKRDFHMFPAIEEAAGDIGEGTVLTAIGWRPVRRQGRDLEVEFKDGVRVVTSDEDEVYQLAEAREDVRRYFRKGAGEWVSWCKSFAKDAAAGGKK